MKLSTAAIFLFTFATITSAKDWCGNPLPPEGWGCYREVDCASHTEWPSESGRFTTPVGAAPDVGFKARGLDRGSSIDLRNLFNCSSIEDVDRRLACEEDIEIRVNSTLTKRFRLDYSGPGYLKGDQQAVSCDPEAGACPQEDGAPGQPPGIPAPECCLFTHECALLLNSHPVIYDSDGDLWDQAYCCIARYEASCKHPEEGPEIDVCFPPTCSSAGCLDTLKPDPEAGSGAEPHGLRWWCQERTRAYLVPKAWWQNWLDAICK